MKPPNGGFFFVPNPDRHCVPPRNDGVPLCVLCVILCELCVKKEICVNLFNLRPLRAKNKRMPPLLPPSLIINH